MPSGCPPHLESLDERTDLVYTGVVNPQPEEDMELRVSAVLEINQRAAEIKQFVKDLDHRLPRIEVEALEEVQTKLSLVLEQGKFWLEESNPQRFAYDLRHLQSWMLEFLGDQET